MKKEYGDKLISINLRGSWLRGIPLRGDDVDVLYIVNNLPDKDRHYMQEFTRCALREKNDLFRMCEGKEEGGMHVDPIMFFDLINVGTIMNEFMYGLDHFSERNSEKARDHYQDSFLGSKIAEKKSKFLKSSILIPYVGWIFGKDKRKVVFDEITKFLPIPTHKSGIYSENAIDETKETLRQAFIARNLIYPSIEITKNLKLTDESSEDIRREAMGLYKSLEPLEEVHARAVINYIYMGKIEEKFLGKKLAHERVEKFAPSYDKLVLDILHEQ
ncbi:MAG: hypothetical protein GTO16_08220 [Candidatus Aminicenantes bacterium]|nr:hypothetical protein [Candidatus Aminicenantes bacterium]